MNRRILLVEGYTDTLLLKALLKKYNIINVDCYPPKDLGSNGNGVSNVIKLLPSLLAKVKTGDFDNFAILVDADYAGVNGGFLQRKQEIEAKLFTEGYSEIPATKIGQFGSEYVCGGFIPIHLAIAPNHSSDGMIEHLLLQSIPPGPNSVRLIHAIDTVKNIPNKIFNANLHSAKAELATYLAWAKTPGCDAGIAVNDALIDHFSPGLNDLKIWLEKVFP